VDKECDFMTEQTEYNTDINDALEMIGKGYTYEDVIREIPASISGFTPAPDKLIELYGYVTALVWGRIWRYCQMKGGVCFASLGKIAEEIGMSERTIIRHVDPLVKDGFLKDMTPSLKNKPHIYADTGKLKIRIGVEATMTESHSAMTESQSEGDRESVEESNKKEKQEEYKPDRNSAKERIAKQRASKGDFMDFLVENGEETQLINDMRIRVESATGLALIREWDKTRSPWNGYENVLIKREKETGQTIEKFMDWYNSDDFRKKGNIWLDPDKIEMWWPQAFPENNPNNIPEIGPDGGMYV